LSSRIATGPIGVSDSIRARIRTDPSLLEEGLRLLGHDVQAGEAGTVDAIAVDTAGRLVIVSIAPPDADRALGRLLDLHSWAIDQRDLLGRLFAGDGVAVDLPARFMLLAPVLSHALVRRLALLPIEVTLLLARAVALEDGAHIVIEPAADILGLATQAAPAISAMHAGSTVPAYSRPAAQAAPPRPASQPAAAQHAAAQHAPPATEHAPASPDLSAQGAPGKPNEGETQSRAAATAFWPDEVLPPEYFDEKAVPLPTTIEADAEDQPWPGSPEDRFPWELPEDPLAPSDEPVAPPETVFETLTAEEMQEFARFDKQRRERNGKSS
jgi:hypothetical protein